MVFAGASIPADDALSQSGTGVVEISHDGHLPSDDTVPADGELKRIGKLKLGGVLVLIHGRLELNGVKSVAGLLVERRAREQITGAAVETPWRQLGPCKGGMGWLTGSA